MSLIENIPEGFFLLESIANYVLKFLLFGTCSRGNVFLARLILEI